MGPDGTVIRVSVGRVDPTNTTVITPGKPPPLPGADKSVCTIAGYSSVPYPVKPPCWDYNTTVNARNGCVGPGGTAPNCVPLGYSMSTFVPKCGGTFALSKQCVRARPLPQQ